MSTRYTDKKRDDWQGRKESLLQSGWKVESEPFGYIKEKDSFFSRPSGKYRDVLYREVLAEKGAYAGKVLRLETRRPFLTFDVLDEHHRIIDELPLRRPVSEGKSWL